MLFILFLSMFSFFVSYGQQKAEWKGTIEEQDGVKVINNPREPLYGEIVLDLEEDLSIGREDDENYLFVRITDIDLDKTGNIYVADLHNFRIQIFNAGGRYIRTIGRKGQGPAEFGHPSRIALDNVKEEIYVIDGYRRVKRFNKKGEYIDQFFYKKMINDLFIMEEGKILAHVTRRDASETHFTNATNALCHIDRNGEIVRDLIEVPKEDYRLKENERVGITTGHELQLQCAQIAKDKLVYGYPKEYELYVVDPVGKILLKIKKDEPYSKLTSEEIREVEDGYKPRTIKNFPPKHKPYFYGIFCDDAGRIYVQRNRQTWRQPSLWKDVDIFSKEGFFIYNAKLPPCTYVIRNGYIYTCFINEDEGLEGVKRYKIKNWHTIKSGT